MHVSLWAVFQLKIGQSHHSGRRVKPHGDVSFNPKTADCQSNTWRRLKPQVVGFTAACHKSQRQQCVIIRDVLIIKLGSVLGVTTVWICAVCSGPAWFEARSPAFDIEIQSEDKEQFDSLLRSLCLTAARMTAWMRMWEVPSSLKWSRQSESSKWLCCSLSWPTLACWQMFLASRKFECVESVTVTKRSEVCALHWRSNTYDDSLHCESVALHSKR